MPNATDMLGKSKGIDRWTNALLILVFIGFVEKYTSSLSTGTGHVAVLVMWQKRLKALPMIEVEMKYSESIKFV